MMDAHPELAVPPETGFLPALALMDPSVGGARMAAELITRFHTWPDFQLSALDLMSEVERCGDTAAADAARTFYRLYAARFGKTRWGDKTPVYGANLDLIESLLPESRFIHLIRDGRDVALSVRPLWFRPGDSVEALAADWKARLTETRARGSRVEHYLETRYEALVLDPERTLREICGFIDLPFDARMLTYYERSGERLEEHGARYSADGTLLI
jgi:hypothetical protein